ncbi:MAG: xanthine dehydrogenase family protein subunit M [Planctomycetota bacterium]|nr:xanthine dehydrogenase family protein subunit M [Planctomycetota bacterium]
MTTAHCPTSVAAALEAMAEPGAVAVAGCTDLMVPGSPHDRQRRAIVDLSRVSELSGIEVVDGMLDMGAGETFANLRRHPDVQQHAPALAEVAATVGALQIQARATLGGNIANASPAGDSLPVLLVLDAELLVAGPTGERTIPYAAMHTGYRRTALHPGELIVRVRVPLPGEGVVQRFRKVGTREAQAISKVVLAFAARLDDGHLRDVRFAAGSVAGTPVRLIATEAACEGAALGAALAEDAGRIAAGEVRPIDDIRSTAQYRRFVLSRCVRRMLLELDGQPAGSP